MTAAPSSTIKKRNAKSQSVLPTRRDVKFDLPSDRVQDWIGDGSVHFTHLMNAMSLVIPVGERFFIDAVRHYRNDLQDPKLKEAATAFIGQEAMHGREHDQYNALLADRLPSAAVFEKRVKALLDFQQRIGPKSVSLSTTIALEHLTAIMADRFLKSDDLTRNAEPGFCGLWRWHALEETEHKGVAFDIWEATQGTGPLAYANRSFGLISATAIFWAMVLPHYVNFVREEGQMTDFKGWRQFYRTTIGEIGFLSKMVRPWFSYFRPSFHPWDDDNSHFLDGIEDYTRRFATGRPATVAA